MAAAEPLYVVTIEGPSVGLAVLAPDADGYEKAREAAIRRERDAIELHRAARERGESLDGVFAFYLLETARAFALLSLKAIEQRIEDQLDHIQTFQG